MQHRPIRGKEEEIQLNSIIVASMINSIPVAAESLRFVHVAVPTTEEAVLSIMPEFLNLTNCSNKRDKKIVTIHNI